MGKEGNQKKKNVLPYLNSRKIRGRKKERGKITYRSG